MSLDSDVIVDRRRIRRKLTFWRVAAVVVAIAAIVAVGEKVDARVIQFDKKARKVQVSIKALEVAEEKEAIAQYGSSDSGATLGDILGTALKNRDK